MEFRVLGPLECLSEGRLLPLGGTKQRALLADLLLHLGQVVPADRLIEDIWGEDPPSEAHRALWIHVTRLRKALDPDRPKRAPSTLLLTRSPGYLLQADPRAVDLYRFDRLVAEGREALSAGAPQAAAQLLGDALDMWRGPALGDLASEPFAQAHITRLEELRLAALEDRIDAELACGHHGRLIGDLESLVAAHPLRERLTGQLMLARYRSGRQGEALEAYQQTRKVLAEELGVDPGPALQRLEGAILLQDPALEWSPPAETAVRRVPVQERPRAPGLLRGGEPPEEIRRTVTFVSATITALTPSEDVDPESLHHLGGRYLDDVRAALTRHDATVHQLTAESVTAVFGVPTAHENDPVRAVRAVADVRSTLERVERELEHDWPVRLSLSAGIETGEVVAAIQHGQLVALTGGIPRLSRRLEQAAGPDGILLGPAAYGMVRDAVEVEDGPVLRRDGATAPYFSWRLVSVEPGASGRARNLNAPMVGRFSEQALLAELFERTVSERACHLVTVVGPAGIGKSRLLQKFVSQASGGATVLRGRCLDYGDAITYWPIAQLLRQAVGATEVTEPAEVRARLGALLAGEPAGDVVAGQLAALIGLTEGTPPAGELPWAVRKLVETLARGRPLVVVLDDLHWAEPVLLELLEYLARFVRRVPLLLCCIARPELFDAHPGWGAGMPNMTLIPLEPLTRSECIQLVGNLLGPEGLSAADKAHLYEVTEGNPLFVEEFVSMLIEDRRLVRSDGRWLTTADLAAIPVPPTISALLNARLDQLGSEERTLLERASIIGQVFNRAAVVELSPEKLHRTVAAHLLSLARKDLIRRHHSELAGEETFRFRHQLIRHATYTSLPKQRRADLHERFATWLEANSAGRVGDGEEIVAYHLEQACRYRAELGIADPALAHRAVDHLTAAGQRAGDRWDRRAASSFLTRARALLPTSDPASLELAAMLVANLGLQGDQRRAHQLVDEGVGLARELGDPRLEARLRVEQQLMIWTDAGAWREDEARDELNRITSLFEEAGDVRGLAGSWLLLAKYEMVALRYLAAEAPIRRAVHFSRLVGDYGRLRLALQLLGMALVYGPTPVPVAIDRCQQLAREAGDNRSMYAAISDWTACLEAMRGNFPRADALLEEAAAILEDMGSAVGWVPWTGHRNCTGFVATLRGDLVHAEQAYRDNYRVLEEAGATTVLATEAAYLANAVYEQGRDSEAERLTRVSEQLTTRQDDLLSQLLWRSVRAKVLARQGMTDEALRLSQRAVELAEQTDAPNDRADAWTNRAVVLAMAGREEQARVALERAFQGYASKGNVTSAALARAALRTPTTLPHELT